MRKLLGIAVGAVAIVAVPGITHASQPDPCPEGFVPTVSENAPREIPDLCRRTIDTGNGETRFIDLNLFRFQLIFS